MRHIFSVFFMIVSLFVTAQRTETAINLSSKNSRLVLEIENDLLFQSDSYYTAGLAFSYTHKNLKYTPAQLITQLFGHSDLSYNGFGIEQRLYTPYSIEEPNSIDNDRPYSAYILISNYSVILNKKRKLKISNEIGIGAMGKIVGGEAVQTIVHEIIGSSAPIGWDEQLNNAFLIDYQFRIEKGIFNNQFGSHFLPFAEARVGTLTDRVKFGIMTRWGNRNSILMNDKVYNDAEKRFIWEWVFEANLQGVFYDATLEGGVWNEDETIELTKQDVIAQQYQLRMGVNFYYNRFSFRYMVKFNSVDFVNGVIHRYGSVNFGYSF